MDTLSSRRGPMIVLAYLWPLALIPLFAVRRDQEIQWHARFGLLLMVVELVVLAVSSIVAGVAVLTNFGLGVVLSVLVWLIWAAIVALQLTALLKALNGNRLAVPGLALLADRLGRAERH